MCPINREHGYTKHFTLDFIDDAHDYRKRNQSILLWMRVHSDAVLCLGCSRTNRVCYSFVWNYSMGRDLRLLCRVITSRQRTYTQAGTQHHIPYNHHPLVPPANFSNTMSTKISCLCVRIVFRSTLSLEEEETKTKALVIFVRSADYYAIKLTEI